MLKTVSLAVFMSLLAIVSAAAAEAPTNPGDCLKALIDAAEKADEVELTDDQFDQVEDLLATMEEYCNASRYDEAMEVAQNVKSMVETRH